MSYQTKGFVWLQMKKLVFFLEENLNKNTKTKTKSDMKVITDFFTSIGEERAPTGTDTPQRPRQYYG